MKIISNEESNNSLNIAKAFIQGLELEFTNEIPDTDELILYINSKVETKNVLFSAESLLDLFGAFDHFSKIYENLIIIPQNHMDFYRYPEPTVINFAGNKLWKTSSLLAGNIYFGKAKDISEILNGSTYNNGIFYKGKYTIVSSIPSLIVDLTDEQLPTISHQMFDIDGYKNMINCMPDMSDVSETPVLEQAIEPPKKRKNKKQ